MDGKLIAEMICTIVGGLGIFLFGMMSISEGMQAVAGEKLRKLIHAVTNNRFVACGVGAVVTSIIQSSSITTVIAVGMVSAGIMTLTQAIGVIFGANIGTTITAWILVIDIGKYGLPMLGVFAIIYLFSKKEGLRYTAMAIMGLGMVFFGLELMKNGFAPLKEFPGFTAWFSRFSPDSYFGVIKCILVGTTVTAVIQSSSATVGITMGLAFNGIIDYPTAAALVMGQNVGTTITAFLASIGTTPNARRAAWAHILFNIIGVLWMIPFFFLYIKGIEAFVGWQSGIDVTTAVVKNGVTTYPDTMEAIAITHTFFNIFNTIVFMPFVQPLANLLNRIIPEKVKPSRPKLTALDARLFEAPALGIEQSQQEVIRMGKMIADTMKVLKEIITTGGGTKEKQEYIFQNEREMDVIQKEVVEFVGHIMTGIIPRDVAARARWQIRIADEYESISDYITNILKFNLKLKDEEQHITEEGQKAILDLHNNVDDYITFINDAVVNSNGEILTEADGKGKFITSLMKKYRAEHIERVESGLATPVKSLIFTDMLNAYRRIKDHGLNIAEVLAGEK
ncbi:MAG: Na/Pi cotransporter family protein [Planctomycetaceae bacterium]|nr:Na/Pi cotransporter family protein [Planctomycetaceae bacterium]